MDGAARSRIAWRCALLVLAVAALAAATPGAAAAAGDRPPWRAAEVIRADLFGAQTELILGERAVAAGKARRAATAYGGELRDRLREEAPGADARVTRGLRAARAAAAAGDAKALAAARGDVRGALFAGAYAVTVEAAGRGDAATARSWLLLREFRTATRFTRPEANGTLAVERLGRRRLGAAQARQAVAKDLLDAYQARLRELLADADAALERRFGARQAETAAQAAEYWTILDERYAQDRGAPAARAASAAFTRAARAAAGGDTTAYRAARVEIDRALSGFTAAPLTAEEAARRAQQLLRFLALVPVEYDRGVSDTRVTLDFEVQEAVAFRTGAEAAFVDLQQQLSKRDAPRTKAVEADLERLQAAVEQAAARPQQVATAGEVEAVTKRAEDNLAAAMPRAWQEPTDESDYDLIALTLDRMEAAVGAGQYRQAEQARLEAYAFFEFGPERRLKSFDPGLAVDIEGLVWFGARGMPGLAELIADRAPRREVHLTRLKLDDLLADAAATLGDSASKATVVTNSAIIVFREGLEAVLILAAITASFAGARSRMRRPVLFGAALGLLASVLTWVLAQTLLRSLEQYGERLEAVVGLLAIAVLLLIMNWFFHKVYWTGWISRFHRQRKKIESGARFGFFSAQVLGLGLLGLTSVYREGFETVLFLQSLELSAGAVTVLEGAGLGLALTLLVAVATFALQRKLPYKRMLIVTGVLIGFVLVVMVGQTARTMQGTGWLPITPIHIEPPYWLGLWFGVFPTWETIGAQSLAMGFVIGSYFLAQEVKVKRPQRRAKAPGAVPAPAAETESPSPNGSAPTTRAADEPAPRR
jgi:high-affinity iron transporter